MNKNNILKCLLASALTMGAATSCDQLDSEVFDSYNTSVFPKTEKDVNSLLVGGVYAPFRNNMFEGLFSCNNRGVQIYNDMCTDLGDCEWEDVYWYDLINVNFNTNQVEGPPLIYRNNINGVTRMTNIIRTIERMDAISEENKGKLIAQARCGRGWLVYILYDMFGGIQFITDEALANPAQNIITPRSSAEETSRFAEEDLLYAATHLPATIPHGSGDYGRFTAGAAYTVLMHLYMYDKRWADAARIGRELMKPEYGYDLIPEFKDVFTLQNEGNKETIWACVEDQGIQTQLWLSAVLSPICPTTNPNIVKWSGYRLPWQFVHSFEPGDKRMDVILTSVTSSAGITYSESNPRKYMDKGAYPVKYGEDPEDTGSGSAIDWIVLRYADVLTLQAEALAREAGLVTAEAVELLNRVRNRAGLCSYSTSDFGSLEAFLDAVLEERGHELWFEGWRRSDLVRHDKFVAYAKLYKKSRTAAPHHVLFPIPQEIINEGRGLVVQNPGY